jgi:hypothetical protein
MSIIYEENPQIFFSFFCLPIPRLIPDTEVGILYSPSTEIVPGKIWKDH